LKYALDAEKHITLGFILVALFVFGRKRMKMDIEYSKLQHKELLKRIPNLHEQVIVVVIKNDCAR